MQSFYVALLASLCENRSYQLSLTNCRTFEYKQGFQIITTSVYKNIKQELVKLTFCFIFFQVKFDENITYDIAGNRT